MRIAYNTTREASFQHDASRAGTGSASVGPARTLKSVLGLFQTEITITREAIIAFPVNGGYPAHP